MTWVAVSALPVLIIWMAWHIAVEFTVALKAGLPGPWEGQNEAGSKACLLWSSVHQFLAQFFDRICPDQGGRGCHCEFAERWTS